MPKITKPGLSKQPPPPPSPVGAQARCRICRCEWEVEEGDGAEPVSLRELYQTAAAARWTVTCPECGAFATAKHPDPKIEAARAFAEAAQARKGV